MLFGKAHELQLFISLLLGAALFNALQTHGIHNVFKHREQREQIKALIDDRDILPAVSVAVDPVRGLPVKNHLAVGGQIEPREHRKGRGLAAAGFADDGVDLALLELKGHVVYRLDGLIPVFVHVGNVFEFE